MSNSVTADDVLNFWFETCSPKDWFSSSDEMDQTITKRFADTLKAASQCELSGWRCNAMGRLAEIIVLDQFSRNIYRGNAQAFTQDSLALALAQEVVSQGIDQRYIAKHRAFVYMPYMHSESRIIHRQAEILFNVPELEQSYAFELKHKLIIDQFGRYPHRNTLLGRTSTEEELTFLAQPGSSF